ncbi:MAG: hypothetical protein ACAI25_02805 [Planctomycetota bacterium]
MRRIAALSSLVVAVTLGAVAARAEDRKPRGLAGVGLTREKVDAAIARAVAYLIEATKHGWPEDGVGFGQGEADTLLATTFAHAGTAARDEEVGRRTMNLLYKWQLGKTYETALVAMALEHLGGPIHRERIADATRLLVERQAEDGSWNYGAVVEGMTERKVPGAAANPVIQVTGGVPVGGLKLEKKGEWGEAGDNSVTQFAVLGLHAAASAGVEAPADTWKRIVAHFEAGQREDGGWAYQAAEGDSYGSMTCAGLTGLSIGIARTGGKPLENAKVKKGLEWLAKNLTFDKNPSPTETEHAHHFYWIYGIERVGVLLDTPFFGTHEWYPEGAKFLLDSQKENGSWVVESNGDGDLIDTCYALLFLTKATAPLPPPRGGQGTLRTSVTGGGDEGTGLIFILDASDSMNVEIKGKSKWAVVRDASKRLAAKVPDGVPVGLRVYGHKTSNTNSVAECESELLIPVGKLDRKKFGEVVDAIKPVGRTPIAFSLDRTANDLASSPVKCRVLLLSDGAETGGGDCVASARALAANPRCLAIDCLGFDIASDPAAREQLKAIAKVGRGKYTESEDPETLAAAGSRTGGAGVSEYVLTDAAGKEVARGKLGDSRPLAEGEYRIKVTIGAKTHEATVWINTSVETKAAVHPERAGP